jgi:hypothetical protein
MVPRQFPTVFLLLLLAFTAPLAHAAGKNKTANDWSLSDICTGLPGFLQSLANVPKDQQPNLNYPVLIFRQYGTDKDTDDSALFWKAGGQAITGKAFVRLPPKFFTPISYTTEPLLILTCHVGSENGAGPDVTDQTITSPDQPEEAHAAGLLPDQPTNTEKRKAKPSPATPVESFDEVKITNSHESSGQHNDHIVRVQRHKCYNRWHRELYSRNPGTAVAGGCACRTDGVSVRA